MTDVTREPMFLIRKGGYFYRPNSQGYTVSVEQAGRYTLAEAESITHTNGPDGPRDDMDYIPDPITRPASTEPADAPKQRPWCETCGKDVHEVLCPTCAKWWNDNPPPNDADAATITALRQRVAELEECLSTVRNPDQRLCCTGQDCGCQGSTVGQFAAWVLNNRSNDHAD